MKFSAFYLAAGVCLGVGATETTYEHPAFMLAFAAAIVLILIGATFEASNP